MLSIVRHSGPAAREPCAQAQSVNTASVILIRFPLQVVSSSHSCHYNKPYPRTQASQQLANQYHRSCSSGGNALLRTRSNASVQRIVLRRRGRCYFFLPDAKPGCHPAAFWLGAAAIVLIFSFLGFLASRLPFCSPLAMSISFGLMMTPPLNGKSHIVA